MQVRKQGAPVHEFAASVESAITSVENKLGTDVKEEQKRFFAIKLIEKDDKIGQQLTTIPDVSDEIKAA